MSFLPRLKKMIQKNRSLLCIGLDPDMSKFTTHLQKERNAIFQFNKMIIDSTHDAVCCYKPNIAFYASIGINGLKQLQETIDYIHVRYTGIPVILDAKRGDIASTSLAYAKEAFDYYKADAVTVNPYLGFDSIEPFLKYKHKGVIILCRTSNPGATDFEDLIVVSSDKERSQGAFSPVLRSRNDKSAKVPLYLHVAKQIALWHKEYDNCLLVVGATWPEQLDEIRNIAPDMFFLIPGIGSQGGNIENTLKSGLRDDGSGLIISASRSIIYAGSSEQVRAEAMTLRDTINRYR
jgi:orotidine-5'-phosphate decarboxylase